MNGIAVKQPHAELIVAGRKTIETRRWRALPPKRYIGGWLAIHASKEWDSTAPLGLTIEAMGFDANERLGGIIGVARLVRAFRFTPDSWQRLAAQHRNPLDWWEDGKIGLELADAMRFEELIECRGKLGFFPLPEPTASKVREQMHAYV